MTKASLSVLGGGQEVGRSSFLLDIGDKILLERGVKLSADEIEYPLPVKTNLDAAIISHAHLDHSGHLPKLFKDSSPLCYMTPPTLDIAKMLWFDTLKIAGYEGMTPEFSEDEIVATEKYTFPISYRRSVDITKNCSLELYDAGHISGSSMPLLSFGRKRFLFTGDFNSAETRLYSGADLRTGEVDYVMMESTYGDRNHPSRAETEKRLCESVQETVDNGGHAIIAAFAVARSQEIIDVLHEYNIDVPIYLDGMSKKASKIFLDYPEYLKDPKFLKKALDKTIWVRKDKHRKEALKQPSVVVTTSGMLSGGPIQNYLKTVHKEENSKIILTGYQVDGTPGRKLLDEGILEIESGTFKPTCAVEKYDFSAHASQSEMIRALKKWCPKKVILVHGDERVTGVLKEKIEKDLGIETVNPANGETIKLD